MTSLGMDGLRIVLFFRKSPNEVIFVELKFAVSHGSLLIQSDDVQLPFTHIVDMLVWNCVSEDDRVALGNRTKIAKTTNTETTIAGIIILRIIKNPNFIFTSIQTIE